MNQLPRVSRLTHVNRLGRLHERQLQGVERRPGQAMAAVNCAPMQNLRRIPVGYGDYTRKAGEQEARVFLRRAREALAGNRGRRGKAGELIENRIEE